MLSLVSATFFRLRYTRHVVSKDGMVVDPEKRRVIVE